MYAAQIDSLENNISAILKSMNKFLSTNLNFLSNFEILTKGICVEVFTFLS